jgi:AraC-like DNA-binding protein
MSFMLTGRSSIRYDDRRKNKYVYNAPLSVLYDMQDFSGIAEYHATQPMRCLSLHFDHEIMHHLLGEDISRWPAVTRSRGTGSGEHVEAKVPLTPSMRMSLIQLLNFPLNDPHGPLFMESKTLELIELYTQGLARQSHRPPVNSATYINSCDQDKLHAARDILVRELDKPPSISALSGRVGLNEFKLKRMFKTRFQNTVYGFVQRERMRQAKALLEDGMSVSQAASSVGYVNFSHFAVAFRKYYGDIPSHFKRRP